MKDNDLAAQADAPWASTEANRTTIGIAGLDDILFGGLIRDRLYLIDGHPGASKNHRSRCHAESMLARVRR
ncbi:MAG: hypothetical protein ABI854_04210 [Betaproteobacteria bacterium]